MSAIQWSQRTSGMRRAAMPTTATGADECERQVARDQFTAATFVRQRNDSLDRWCARYGELTEGIASTNRGKRRLRCRRGSHDERGDEWQSAAGALRASAPPYMPASDVHGMAVRCPVGVQPARCLGVGLRCPSQRSRIAGGQGGSSAGALRFDDSSDAARLSRRRSGSSARPRDTLACTRTRMSCPSPRFVSCFDARADWIEMCMSGS